MYYRSYTSNLTPAEREAKRIAREAREEAAFQRKIAKMEAQRAKSKFNYATAGGYYVPTRRQYEHALTMGDNGAALVVINGYQFSTKVNHDAIHVVNESLRALESSTL